MKWLLSSFAVCVAVLATPGVVSGATGRVGVVQNNIMSTSRMPSVPVATVGVTTSVSNVKSEPATVIVETKPVEKEETPSEQEQEKPAVDMREKERDACIRNNIGVGNTFVWASRYSDINNYATMVEDTENPDNNTCFVRVELKSSDSRIDLSDISGKYFEMGRNITCGSWADEGKIENRILDAKKKGRTWATVGGAVGGAALGVGAMELFGNDALGKMGVESVQGQKALSGTDLLYSQLQVMKKDKSKTEQYNKIISQLKTLKEECDKDVWVKNGVSKPSECSEYDYNRLLSVND